MPHVAEGPTTAARVAETHSGVVFLVGDRAFKLKKPVDLGFLDFRTREAREAACRREVELNRRLAPDVYLGVADVIGPDGEPWDHLVVMRRMPDERRLSTLVESGADVDEQLRLLADRLAAFHAEAATSAAIDEAAGWDAESARWEENAREMEPFVGGVLDPGVFAQVGTMFHRYLAGRRLLFERRIAGRRARDGHGDLLADDIFCLDDGPRLLDCLEFDDRLRYGDVLSDVAFLAMDLERLGRGDLGALLLEEYRRAAGDSWPASLAHHYVAYRAQVRSKVACVRWDQGDEASAPAAGRLLAICRDHLAAARVRLVLVGGLPGTGKSTLARGLASRLAARVLRSDEVRKELAGLSPTDPAPAPPGEGLYDQAHTEATYGELLSRVRRALELGDTVVADASWLDPEWRTRARVLAEEVAADIVELRCVLPTAAAAARIERRRVEGGDASDATAEVAAALAAGVAPWPEARTVDTSGDPDPTVDSAVRFVSRDDAAARA